MTGEGVSVEKKCKSADTVVTIDKNVMCRGMKEGELRIVLNECVRRGISPKELASLADFEKLHPQLKKVVKQMNADINASKIKVK